MHGRMNRNQDLVTVFIAWPMTDTFLSIINLLSPVITHTHPVAGNLQ